MFPTWKCHLYEININGETVKLISTLFVRAINEHAAKHISSQGFSRSVADFVKYPHVFRVEVSKE